MSLLDDVSIVVTPNGYKAGELYAVVPVPTEGAEEVTNGDFATDSDWVKGTGWAISGGTANCDGSQSGNTDLTQIIATSVGKQYKITYTVSNYSAGSIKIRLNSGNVSLSKSSNGTFTEVLSGQGGGFSLRADLDFTGSIDNVSVKEYTAADMDVTRATAATRVDENGLVNYAEIVGSEEVTNGDFATSDLSDFGTTYATQEIVSEELKTTLDTANGYGFSKFTFTAEIGKSYRILASCKQGTGNTTNVKSNSGITIANETNAGSWSYDEIGVATSTTCQIRLQVWGGNGVYGLFDSISVKEVTRDNVPRIDYSGGGCPHILAEPLRTNLALNSDTFSGYNTSNVNISSSSTLSPDGVSTAIKLALDSGTLSSNGGMSFSHATTVGDTLSWSMFVKKAEYRYLTFSFGSGSAVGFHFDLDTGLITQNLTNAAYTLIENKIEEFNNGWYKISVSFTELSGSSNRFVCVKPSPVEPTASNNSYSSTGDGTSGIYIWGAQLESGSFPTSYIPTSVNQVTRNQDQFSRDGISSLIGQTEGTLVLKISKPTTTVSVHSLISFNNAASNSDADSVAIGFSNSNSIYIRVKAGGTSIFTENNTTTSANTFYKVAISYKSGSSLIYIDGNPITPNAGSLAGTFTFSTTLDNLSFDGNGGSTFPFYGGVQLINGFKTALIGTQLAALTS